MARQQGPPFITGTIGDLVFYKMNGAYFVRRKSDLDAKQVRRDPSFRQFRNNSGHFGKAARIVKIVYWQLGKKDKILLRTMQAKAYELLRAGREREAVVKALQQLANSKRFGAAGKRTVNRQAKKNSGRK